MIYEHQSSGFDIGQMLVYYPAPLNWSALYRTAFESVAKKNGLEMISQKLGISPGRI